MVKDSGFFLSQADPSPPGSFPSKATSQNLPTPFSLSSVTKPLLIFQARVIHWGVWINLSITPPQIQALPLTAKKWIRYSKEIIGRLSAKKKEKEACYQMKMCF